MKQNTPADLPAVGAHFLEFVIQFFTADQNTVSAAEPDKSKHQGFQLLFLLKSSRRGFPHYVRTGSTDAHHQAAAHPPGQCAGRKAPCPANPRYAEPAAGLPLHHTGGKRIHEAVKTSHAVRHRGGGSPASAADELNELDDCLKKLSSLLPRLIRILWRKIYSSVLFYKCLICGFPVSDRGNGKRRHTAVSFFRFRRSAIHILQSPASFRRLRQMLCQNRCCHRAHASGNRGGP